MIPAKIDLKNSTKNREAWRVNGILKKVKVRCGKINCRCSEGQEHGPYWYLQWNDGTKSRRRYIKRKDLDVIRAALSRGHQWRDKVKNKRRDFKGGLGISKLIIKRGLKGYDIPEELFDMSFKNLQKGFYATKLGVKDGWYTPIPDEWTQIKSAGFVLDCFLPDAK